MTGRSERFYSGIAIFLAFLMVLNLNLITPGDFNGVQVYAADVYDGSDDEGEAPDSDESTQDTTDETSGEDEESDEVFDNQNSGETDTAEQDETDETTNETWKEISEGGTSDETDIITDETIAVKMDETNTQAEATAEDSEEGETAPFYIISGDGGESSIQAFGFDVGNGSGQAVTYNTLEEAIANARDGDTIVFTTMDPITLSNTVELNKSITFKKDESLGDSPIIIYGPSGARHFNITNSAYSAELTFGETTGDFILDGNSYGGGIEANGVAYVTIKNLTVQNCNNDFGGAFRFEFIFEVYIENCHVMDNRASYNGGGIYFSG
ncbi:MAG: hypothetical protein LBU94_05200, partial [Clostridiales bacterium]|nr:hypothetical protein [Clostridiales bacterium]